jgi:hypothetical protein
MTIHRTTISIPSELKERMDAIKDQVNWSAVAARAFQAELDWINRRSKRTMNKEDIVKRMKAEAEEDSKEEYQEGYEMGKDWAQEYAKPRELRALDNLSRNSGCDLSVTLAVYVNGMNHSIAWGLWQAIYKQEPNHDEVRRFWEEALGDDNADRIEDQDFARGFCEGALAIWEEVKDEV